MAHGTTSVEVCVKFFKVCDCTGCRTVLDNEVQAFPGSCVCACAYEACRSEQQSPLAGKM